MSLRLSVAATILALAVTSAVASAQINLVPSAPLGVPADPEYAALGNIDTDPAFEAFVLSPDSNSLSVYNATQTGLAPSISVTLGRRLSGLAVRDFDGDGRHDVLVANATGGAQNGDLLLLRGLSIGGLASAESFPLPISALRAFASGDFDGINGPDAVLATGTRGDVAVLLNDGAATAFNALPLYDLERDPRIVRAARIDTTGRDSILILNTNESRFEEIVVLRLDDGVLQQPVPPIRIPGTDPVDFVTGDFNRDGAVDIAVLQDEIDNIFFVTTMLNQTEATPEGSRPTGTFRVLPGLEFDCPTTSGGNLTRCIPESLVAGDFDRDGFTDLAVAMSRPGEVLYLNGIGAGEFGFAGRFRSVDADEPTTLAAGDMTGNLASDLFVADIGNDTAVLLRSNVPTPAGDGDPCLRGNECASQVCLDGVCCQFLTCPSNQRCDVPGSEGRCAPLAFIGSPCDDGDTCNSSYCVDGVCCANPSCPGDQRCDIAGSAGVCSVAPPTATASPTATRTPLPAATPTPQPNGRACTDPIQCDSTVCDDGFCCEETCAEGLYCNITSALGTCTARRFVGQTCSVDTDCATLLCPAGLCAIAASPTPTQTPSPSPTGAPLGRPCSPAEPLLCDSNLCTNGVCCSEAGCAIGERCDIFGLEGNCRTQLPPGSACAKDSDCRDGACRFDSTAEALVCQRVTPTPGAQGCFGDCSGDGAVTVDEILVMIEIALGTRPVTACPPGDISGDGGISVDELVTAVGLALTGCPDVPTPNASATMAASPTPTVPPTATEPPSPTATAVVVDPTATATPTSSASPTAVPPTATAPPTVTPSGIDLSLFDEFVFARATSPGSCPPLGDVLQASITRAGSLFVLELDVLRAGIVGEQECLADLVDAGECPIAVPISPVPTILTASEVSRLGEVFGAIRFAQAPGADCDGELPVCDVAEYAWDGLSSRDDPCDDTNRLEGDQADRIRGFLAELQAAREAG